MNRSVWRDIFRFSGFDGNKTSLYPEPGTICDSIPEDVPTNITLVSGAISEIASARAIPGNICPAVPPPHIITFINCSYFYGI